MANTLIAVVVVISFLAICEYLSRTRDDDFPDGYA